MSIKEEAAKMKLASPLMASAPAEKRNSALLHMIENLEAGKEKIGKVKDENIKIITKDFKICDTLDISPFEVMHDAEQTIGYEIRNSEGKKITLATDIGYITNGVKERFKGSDVILIESNYDYNMLMNGPYPWELKNRVKGKN